MPPPTCQIVKLAQLLKAVTRYSDRLQSDAQTSNWRQAQSDLIRLRQSAQQLSKQLPSSNPGIQQINANIDQLEEAVASQDQQKVQQSTNRLIRLALLMNTQTSDPFNGSLDSQSAGQSNEQYSTETISVSK